MLAVLYLDYHIYHKAVVNKTVNKAGGEAYVQSAELALVSMLLTNFVNSQFYRTENQSIAELKELLEKVNPEFAAKAAIYARDKFAMRSITHVLAAELASKLSGVEWGKNFYDRVVNRVDDMSEILSYYYQNKGSKMPNSIKKGFAKAFDKFDGYNLAKYRSDNKGVKLIDIVNLVHPIPTEKNSEALKSLVDGKLKSTDTWESMLSQAGQAATSDEEKMELKADAWGELLTTGKIGQFALLRNLRNIIEQAPLYVGFRKLCNW